ncbi:MAG TPA: electron transport complex subunit RsxC, partial [Candidatus Competibacteraceae bacterium]|nr:electron transport complex subunit RsxC [Candidatus Competibacteraceae bacterium]
IAHPSGLAAPCLVIDSDGLEQWTELPPPLPDWARREPAAIRARARECGLVGLGGAAFPTAVKLNAAVEKPIELLVLNGAECEPYITCDDMLMRDRAAEIVAGLRIMRHALQAQRAVIAVEDNKPEARAALQRVLAESGTDAAGIELRVLPTRYPIGGEKQLIKALTGLEVPSHGLPADLGIVCHNVATAYALYEAVLFGRPLIARYVTVTGDGIREPQVLEALIGTAVNELVAQCGGYQPEVRRLIMGGPMMGFTLSHDAVPIVKGSNCILALRGAPPAEEPMPCIRCAACVEVCPAHLLPQQLYWYTRAKDFDQVQDYHLFDCIECGCCAAVCPSHIPLVQYYRYAKSEIWAREREKEKAELARTRHTARQERLEREQEERAAKLRKKKEAVSAERETAGASDPKKAAIEAALAKAKAKARKAAAAASEPAPGSGGDSPRSAEH